MLVKATPTSKKVYTIILASADASSYESPTGSPWNATYFLNINGIMDDQEASRPYFVTFTFSSAQAADITTQGSDGSLLLELDFNGRTLPHVTQWSQRYLPCGFISVVQPANPTLDNLCSLRALHGDNAPVYIHSLKGISNIRFRTLELTGALFTSTANFICVISLEPASF